MSLKLFKKTLIFLLTVLFSTSSYAGSCGNALKSTLGIKDLRDIMEEVNWVTERVLRDLNREVRFDHLRTNYFRRNSISAQYSSQINSADAHISDVSFSFSRKENDFIFKSNWATGFTSFGQHSLEYKISVDQNNEFVAFNGSYDVRAAKYFLSALANANIIRSYSDLNEILGGAKAVSFNKDGSISMLRGAKKNIDIVNQIIHDRFRRLPEDGNLLSYFDKHHGL